MSNRLLAPRKKLWTPTRRSFLRGLGTSIVAPYVAKAQFNQGQGVGSAGFGNVGSGSGPTPYVAKAVRFAAGAYGDRGAPLTGVSNSPSGTCFYWFNSAPVLTNILISLPGYSFTLYDGDGGEGFNTVTDALGLDGPNFFFCNASNSAPNIMDGNWYGIARSWDVSDPDPMNWKAVFVIGETGTMPQSYGPTVNFSSGPGFDVRWVDDDFAVMGDGSTETSFREVSQLWATSGVFMNASQLISAFWGADNKPKSLGVNGQGPTGSSPPIYCDGDASVWLDNLGTGGSFSNEGDPITNASTSPSD